MTISTSLRSPVLVATDFSEDSKTALVWACQLVEVTSAPLVLLHVVHDLPSHPGFYQSGNNGRLEPMQNVAEAMMDRFLQQLRGEQPALPAMEKIELKFVPGLPPGRIVEVAGLLHAGLIVLGSRGISGGLDKSLGTTTERVAQLSEVPVVIVKSETRGTSDKDESKHREERQEPDRKKTEENLGGVKSPGIGPA